MKTPSHTPGRRPSLRDDDGAAMLEFVLIAPLLCYLIVGMLFFRHELDYAQDSVSLINQLMFAKTAPDVARGVRDEQSDRGGFSRYGVTIHDAVLAAGLLGADLSVGGGVAAERYYGDTPYARLGLITENYFDNYQPETDQPGVTEPENRWRKQLGQLGVWFGNRIGGGEVVSPEGLRTAGWVERYPSIMDAWQRQFSSQLDADYFPVLGTVLDTLDAATQWACAADPLPRFDNRDTDIGASEFVDGGGTCGELSLQSASDFGNIVK